MAVCSTTTMAISSCNLSRWISSDPSTLSSSISIRSTPFPPFSTVERLSAVSRRQIIPKVAAKKQTFSSFDELLKKSDKPVLVDFYATCLKQTFSSFDELLKKSDKPVLVDFYATWCGPCQFMVPVLEQVSEKMQDKIQIVKIDTEKYTNIADEYKIAALPTFIIFKDGKPCDRFEGAFPADQLIQRIENALKVLQ